MRIVLFKNLILVCNTLAVCSSFAALATTPPQAYAESTANPPQTIKVQTIPGPTVTQTIEHRIHDSWPWYIVRASGMVAAVSLVLLLLSGVGHITGTTYRFLPPLIAWASHRTLGIVSSIAIVLHIGGLLFDHYLPFNLAQLFIPWLSNYKPVTIFGLHLGSLYVAFGVLAFYLMVGVMATSLLWVERKPRVWKFVHFTSYLIMALVFVHALYIGTDTSHGWVRIVWLVAGLAIATAGIVRVRRVQL